MLSRCWRSSNAATFLEFFAAAARARVISADFWPVAPKRGSATKHDVVPVTAQLPNVHRYRADHVGLHVNLQFGLIGVAVGTAVPNLVYAVYLVVTSCRATGTPVLRYVTYVYGRLAIAALAISLALALVQKCAQPTGIFGLAGAGALTVVLFGAAWLFLVVPGDRYLGETLTVIRRRLTR